MLNVEIDAKELLSLTNINKKIEQALRRDLKKINKAAEKQAMTAHRYKRRTGKLQYATRGYVKDMTSVLMVDGRIAPYGLFVHEGQRSWAPDRFITRAGDKMEKEVEDAISKAIDKALKEK